MYVPNPTWGNHNTIFGDSGLQVKFYRYYQPKTKGLDLEGLLADVKAAPPGSLFVFHACAHNPTGVDPRPEQWQQISQAVKEAKHFVVIDSAYQGFASGDPTKDAFAIQQFVQDGHQIALAQSFSKNFGLYGQRVGCVSFITDSAQEASNVESQVKILARAMYSNPPIHGSRIVSTILKDPELKKQWHVDVKEMAERIISMRDKLRAELERLGSKHNWQHITDQIGMFCFSSDHTPPHTSHPHACAGLSFGRLSHVSSAYVLVLLVCLSGLSPEQVDRLTNEYHIYLTRNGRISMAGVTSKDIPYLAKAIHEVSK